MRKIENVYLAPTPNQTTGFASPAETEREPNLSLDKRLIVHPAATFFLQADANWPEFGILSGDLLVIDRAWDPAHGLLALGVIEGEFCLGRLQKLAIGWQLGAAALTHDDSIWGVLCHVVRTHI